MELSATERRIAGVLTAGLPLVSRPYAALARDLGMDETVVVATIRDLLARGVLPRLGLVVRHHELGYRANAMVVWDVDDAEAPTLGRLLASYPCVTLSYRRPRRLPVWRYNLFCMVHGHDKREVRALVRAIAGDLGLEGVPYEILFSQRRFKQQGACYGATPTRGAA